MLKKASKTQTPAQLMRCWVNDKPTVPLNKYDAMVQCASVCTWFPKSNGGECRLGNGSSMANIYRHLGTAWNKIIHNAQTFAERGYGSSRALFVTLDREDMFWFPVLQTRGKKEVIEATISYLSGDTKHIPSTLRRKWFVSLPEDYHRLALVKSGLYLFDSMDAAWKEVCRLNALAPHLLLGVEVNATQQYAKVSNGKDRRVSNTA